MTTAHGDPAQFGPNAPDMRGDRLPMSTRSNSSRGDHPAALGGRQWRESADHNHRPGNGVAREDHHRPGPEEVYVVSGVLNDGVNDYPAGTFLHAPAESWHIPQSDQGCVLFLFYPQG